MPGRFRATIAAPLLAAACVLTGAALAQTDAGSNSSSSATADNMLLVPHVRNIPGNVKPPAPIVNPMANDPNSAQRGMEYFVKFNCVGCHAANGAGGMGISLADSSSKFGASAASIYLVIAHGAPLGMPAWGSVLPSNVIWDLVSYVQGLAKKPTTWGTTVSPTSPGIEQVPAEFKQTPNPWQYTEPFKNGQKPTERKPTSPLGMTTPNNHPGQ